MDPIDGIRAHVIDENGELRERVFRPHEFLQNPNIMRDANARHLPGQRDKGRPEYGLLTQTVANSSVIRDVFPARIRSKLQRDVVFVAENYVELRVLNPSGLLETVARKTDFGSDIRCAKVLWTGEQVKFDLDGLNPVRISGPKDECHKHLSNELFKDDDKLPPQIVVLTLGSGNLMFLYAKDVGSEVEWVVSTKKVAQEGSYLQQLGSHLAIDPHSRAIALASWDGYIRLYSVRKTAEMKEQVESGLELMPLDSDHTFKVSGTICFMEFLYPEEEQKGPVILLVYLVDARKNSRLRIIEWTESRPLDTARQHGQDGLMLPRDISVPLLMIPSKRCTSVILVCEYMIYIVSANDIVSGNTVFASFPVPLVTRKPRTYNESLITAWSRPFRAPSYASHHDDLFLVKENGDLFYLEITSGGPIAIETTSAVGNIQCRVGKAFAALDYGLSRGDLLCAPGELGDGRTVLLKADCFRCLQLLPNWSQITDFELVTLKGPDEFHSMSCRDRVFACTGRDNYGAVSEIRYGKEALATDTIDYMVFPNRMWLFSSRRIHYVVTSALMETEYLKIQYSNPKHDKQLTTVQDMEAVNALSIGLSKEVTLAASCWENKIIQVTRRGVYLSHAIGFEGMSDEKGYFDDEGDIVMAAVRNNVVVLIRRGIEELRVEMGTIFDEPGHPLLSRIGESMILPSEPSFVEILELNGIHLALVGMHNSEVVISQLNTAHYAGLRYIGAFMIEPPMHMDEETANLCESAVILSNNNVQKLVLGLRNGMIMSQDIRWNEEFELEISPNPAYFQIGKIVVRLVQKDDLPNKALAHSNNELYELELDSDDVKISQVVFTTDIQGQVLPEPIIEAVAYFDNEVNFEPFTESILCLTKTGTIIAAISRLDGVCKRSMPLNETPRKLLYYDPLDLLVVACWKSGPMDSTGISRSPTGGRGPRGLQPPTSTLKFVNPRSGDSTTERDLKDCTKAELIFPKTRERIYALENWEVKQDARSYRFILVGTGFVNASGPPTMKGRLLVLTISKSQRIPELDAGDTSAEMEVQVRKKYQFPCEGPVTAIAGFGDSSLVYAAGKVLCMKTLNMTTRKWEDYIEYSLRSEAMHITVNEPYVTVSCREDSLVVFKVENGAFTMFCSDSESRSGFSHIPISDDLFLVSDKDVAVQGLWQPPIRRTKGDMSMVFETEMLSSICKFKTGQVRNLWHNPNASSSYSPPPGLAPFDKDIIGAGVDGAIYHFTLLTLDALHLLKVVQAIYYSCNFIQGSGSSGSDKGWERSRHVGYYQQILAGEELAPQDRNVSGDVLVTVYRRGESWFRGAIGPEGTEAYNVLRELAAPLLGPEAAADPVPAIRHYIKQLLLSTVTL